jgi:hypothetical protein
MKNRIVILLALSVAVLVTQLFASDCNSPKITIKNDKATAIKVAKLIYFDTGSSRERTENLTDTEIQSGATRTFTDNLLYVGNTPIRYFKIYLATRQGTGSTYGSYSWSAPITPDQGASQRCNTGVTFTIHVHN